MQESRSPSENIASLLPEVIERRDDDKEAVTSHGKEVAGAEEKEFERTGPDGVDGPEAVDVIAPDERAEFGVRKTSGGSRKKSRRRRLLGCVATIIILVLSIGLGIGLGVGLNVSQGSSSTKAASGSGNQYYSKRGAFNGTGISWTSVYGSTNLTSDVAGNANGYDDKFLYFQHWTGEIRWMYQGGPEEWKGGTINEVIATDAKNGTSISTHSPTGPGVHEYDVYYVNKENLLRQRSIDHSTYKWTDGPLNDLNISVFDADRVGLKACLYLGLIADVPANGTVGHGTRLFVATGEETFEQLSWYPGMKSWVLEQRWSDLNGHASPACFGWAMGHTFYAWFVNAQNTIDMWWINSANKTSTSSHPINQWTKSSLIYPAVDPSMGLDFQYILYAKLATGEIHGWKMTLQDESSTFSENDLLETISGPPPAYDSQLAVTAIPAFSEPREAIVVFYQTTGDDITMFTGDKATGKWNVTKVPIPDD